MNNSNLCIIVLCIVVSALIIYNINDHENFASIFNRIHRRPMIRYLPDTRGMPRFVNGVEFGIPVPVDSLVAGPNSPNRWCPGPPIC